MYVFCEKTFAQNNEMKIHEKKSHMGKPYACSFCDKMFAKV